MKTYTLAQKLTSMSLLVSGSALLLASIGFIAYDWATFRANSVRNLSIQAEIIATNSSSAVLFNVPETAEETLALLKNSPNIVFAGIFTPDGKPFAVYERADLHPSGPSASGTEIEIPTATREREVARAPILAGQKTIGTVYIESTLQTLYDRLIRYVSIAGIVFVISLLGALVVSWFYQRSVNVPIVALAEATRTVAREKDFSVRVSGAQTLKELDSLVESFNEMLDQIGRRDRELQQSYAEMEDRVRDRTAQLTAANAELEAFSYSVSHDLRAPLRSIDGFSQAVLDDYAEQLDATAKDYLLRVRAAAVRMGLLIDDLLKLSRVARSDVKREPADLTAMAKDIAQGLQDNNQGREVEFRICEGMKAQADPRLLRVALENLLENAWKYTSRHEHALIEVGRKTDNGSCVFYVKDDGAGFDSQYADRLFGAFQRLHGVKDFPGTGIGLATVQRVIHKHGGKIWAEAEVEKGATFYFSL